MTGASGFVAAHIIEAFVGAGHVVRALTRGSGVRPGQQVEVARWAGVHDTAALRLALKQVDAVIHLAARVHVMRESAADPLDQFRRVNSDGSTLVLKESIAAGVPRFVLASTVKAVGESNSAPWTESTPPEPVDAYGISKWEAEQRVVDLATGSGTAVSVIRLPMVYGPGMKGNMPRLFRLVDRGVPLPFAGIENRRSMVFCGNVAAAVKWLVLSCQAASETFFISDDVAPSTPRLIEEIGRCLGKKPRLFRVPRATLSLIGAAGDMMNRVTRCPVSSAEIERLTESLVVDATKLIQHMGASLPYAWAAGIATTADWYVSTSR